MCCFLEIILVQSTDGDDKTKGPKGCPQNKVKCKMKLSNATFYCKLNFYNLVFRAFTSKTIDITSI